MITTVAAAADRQQLTPPPEIFISSISSGLSFHNIALCDYLSLGRPQRPGERRKERDRKDCRSLTGMRDYVFNDAFKMRGKPLEFITSYPRS